MSISILHLTDIHAGPGELKDEDLKVKIPGVERKKMLDRLTKYVHALPSVPHFVVVTGDLTIQGSEIGLADFRSWVEARINEKVLPKYDRIMVVPGNHDVKWKVPKANGWHKERYQAFHDKIARVFPHAYLPESDPPIKVGELEIPSKPRGLIGGLTTKRKLDRVEITRSWPFLLDLKNDLLIFAFNSTLGCGVYLEPSREVVTPLDQLLAINSEGPNQAKLKAVKEGYQESLLIDAGYVGDEQLDTFSAIMNRLKKKLKTRYSALTKIALLHHHVSHLWQQQLEVKHFETVLDASQLKQRLIEHEFDMVLHGHKHTNHVALDGSVIPVNSQKQFSPLCICSGGTVGGYPRLQDRQSFKLITLDEPSGPRTRATITETPLFDEDPGHVIKAKSTIYPIPISSRLLGLHDLTSLKKKADDFIFSHCAPEVGQSKSVLLRQAQVEIPTANPDLLADASHYACYLVADSESERVFYDIFLATDEAGFKEKARIYWLLNDVKGLSRPDGKKCRVVVMIGNFEQTHFFKGRTKGEIKQSINKLQDSFAPACKSGLLEVRSHSFSQPEVDDLVREVRS